MIGDILQPTHLLFILVVALLVLGPKRLPEAGRALGRGLRDFKGALTGDDDHPELVRDHPPESTPAYTPDAQAHTPESTPVYTPDAQAHTPEPTPAYTPDTRAHTPDVTPTHPPDLTQPQSPAPAPTAKPEVAPTAKPGVGPTQAVDAEPVDATVESSPPARRPAEHIG